MFNKKIENYVDMLIKNEKCKSIDREIIIYGIYTGIEYVFNIVTTIILGFLFGLVLESILFLLFYSFLRTYAGGYHCQKAINCYLFSSAIVMLVLSIVKLTPIKYMFIASLIMLVASAIVIMKFAPVETPHKPLDVAEIKRYRRKMLINLGLECIAIGVMFLFSLNSFAFAMSLGIIVTACLVFLQKALSVIILKK